MQQKRNCRMYAGSGSWARGLITVRAGDFSSVFQRGWTMQRGGREAPGAVGDSVNGGPGWLHWGGPLRGKRTLSPGGDGSVLADNEAVLGSRSARPAPSRSGQNAVVSGGSHCGSGPGGLPLKRDGWCTCRIRCGAGALRPVWTDADRRQRVPGRQPGEPSVWPQLRSRQARTKRVATSGVRPQCRWT